MKKGLNKHLISSIEEVVAKGTNIANLLMDILDISKDAIYRRIRGEVSFTFEELANISEKLNISLDNIIGLKSSEQAVFNLNLLRLPATNSSLSMYVKFVSDYATLFHRLNQYPNSKISMACNAIPPSIIFQYPYLLKFRLYRWMSQSGIARNMTPMSEIEYPEELIPLTMLFVKNFFATKNLDITIDRSIITHYVKEVAYFAKLDLLTNEELANIKKELFEMLDFLESLAASGKYNNENSQIMIYLSNINIDTSYVFYGCDAFSSCDFLLYSINAINTQNPIMSNIQEEWINTLKRFSTLITYCGEIDRRNFFNTQRKHIIEIL
jgi:hypothetical protein